MAKDPAFLFYSDNFQSGTQFLTDEQTGKYIRLMCAQHLHGHLTEKQMLIICKSYDKDIWDKFVKDDSGNYFNQRLETEILKRKNYSLSRSLNKKGHLKTKGKKKSYDYHMGNENGNEIEDINAIGIDQRRKNFYEEVGIKYSDKYPKDMLIAFCNYWTEHNEGAKKMKFEMQKVFNISMRLVTWNNNNKNFKNGKSEKPTPNDYVAEYRKRTQTTNVDDSTRGKID